MQYSYLFGLIIWLVLMLDARATKVGFSPFSDRTVVDSGASTIGTSALVWVGNFANETFSLNNALSLAGNVTAIQAAGGWKQFGLDTVTGNVNAGVTGSLGINASGKLFDSIEDTSTGATKADFFNSKNLYVWIFDGGSVGSSSEMGIFRAPAASTPWQFPINGGGLGDSTTYSTNSAVTAVVSAIGGIGSTSSSQLTLTGITPIPEPTTCAAGALLALVASCVRRRRR